VYGAESAMCGIFGVICSSDRAADRQLARELAISLLHHSETRGREAVGVAIHDGEQIHVLKQAGSVTDFLANGKFHRLIDGVVAAGKPGRPIAITGHSRLATNGAQSNGDNNQPVITHGTVALHNGIVVNDRQLTERYPAIAPQGELDSEVLAALLRTKLDGSRNLVAATRAAFAEIEGSASLAMLFDDLDTMLLATNTGSLFQLTDQSGCVLAFASERFILQRVQPGVGEEVGDRAALLEHLDARAVVDRQPDRFAPAGLGEPEQRDRELAREPIVVIGRGRRARRARRARGARGARGDRPTAGTQHTKDATHELTRSFARLYTQGRRRCPYIPLLWRCSLP